MLTGWLIPILLLATTTLTTTTKTSTTSTTATLDRSRKELVQQVESSLLSLFGFASRPPRRRSSADAQVHVPQDMIDLYKRQTGKGVDMAGFRKPGVLAGSANTVRSFTHVESPIDTKFSGHHRFRLYFDITSVPKKEILKAAEITITRESISLINDNSKSNLRHLLVHDIIRPGRKGKHEPITRLIDSKIIDIRQNHSVNVDVLPAVERWLENSKNNHGVIIQLVGKGGKKSKPTKHLRLKRGVNDNEWNKKQPLLFTYTDDGKNKGGNYDSISQKRARRASYKKKNRKEGLCRRQSMYVDFNEVGWNDWIVAPPGYDAFYCSGECNFPLADHMNTTNHAIVQTLMNSATPTAVPKACCVPTSLNSISMLYLDENNKVVLKNYQDMAVLGCGCR